MEAITSINLSDKYKEKQAARESLAQKGYRIEKILKIFPTLLEKISTIPFGTIDMILKSGKNLDFDQAFVGMTYVIAATNTHFLEATKELFQKTCGTNFSHDMAIARGASFLQALAMKEALLHLTPDEIAGVVAAGNMDVVLRANFNDKILETCGMGGDKGFYDKSGKRKKTINVSTLSAIVLSSLGIPTIKHGSYANTAAVGSTEAIEKFGVKLNHDDPEKIVRLFKKVGFHFSDAHLVKTLHDLSHLLMHETINHIIGPMTPPITNNTTLYKVMGVNHHVHPKDVAMAYEILNRKKIQMVGNVIVVAGLDTELTDIDPEERMDVKRNSFLDELSPMSSLLAIVQWGEFIGCYLVSPEDFGIEIDAKKIQLENTEKIIQEANMAAISGRGDDELTKYLAMNATLGLFCFEHLNDRGAITKYGLNQEMLRDAFGRCLEAIKSGRAKRKLEEYIKYSNEI